MDLPDILASQAQQSSTVLDLFESGAPVPAFASSALRNTAGRAGPLDDDDDDEDGDSWSKGGDDDDEDEDEDDLDDEDEDSADSVWAAEKPCSRGGELL